MLETKDFSLETKIFFFSPVTVVEVIGLLLILSHTYTPSPQNTFFPYYRKKVCWKLCSKRTASSLFFFFFFLTALKALHGVCKFTLAAVKSISWMYMSRTFNTDRQA